MLHKLLLAIGCIGFFACQSTETPKETTSNPLDSQLSATHQQSSADFPQKSADQTGKTDTATDAGFVKLAIVNSLYTQGMAKLAIEKSSRTEVQEIAKHIQKDHGRFLSTLKEFEQPAENAIKENKKPIPAGLDKKQRDWDSIWLEEMIEGYNSNIRNYELATETADEAKLKEFAHTNLAVLKGHLERLKELKDQEK